MKGGILDDKENETLTGILDPEKDVEKKYTVTQNPARIYGTTEPINKSKFIYQLRKEFLFIWRWYVCLTFLHLSQFF